MGSLEEKLLFQALVCENSEVSTYSVIAVVNSDGIGARKRMDVWNKNYRNWHASLQESFIVIWDIAASSSIYHANIFGSYLPS